MKSKYFKSFSHIAAKNQNWNIGSATPTDEDFSIAYNEFHSPTLKCVITPMPKVCRFGRKNHAQAAENMFLSSEPIFPAEKAG